MTASQRHRSPDRVRIFILCALLILIGGEWLLIKPGKVPVRATGVTAAINPAEQHSLISVAPNAEAYSSVITSDLFRQTREAPPGVLARLKPPSTVHNSADMRVIGIVTAGIERIAILQSGTLRPMRVRVGDTTEGSTVTQITPSYIVLQNNGLERILALGYQVRSAAQRPATVGGKSESSSASVRSPISAESDVEAFDRVGAAAVDEILGTRQFDSLTQDSVPANPATGE